MNRNKRQKKNKANRKKRSTKPTLNGVRNNNHGSKSPLFPGQLTKILDTNTPRKEGLKNLYMLVVESKNALDLSDNAKDQIFSNMLEVSKKLAKVADAVDNYNATEPAELHRLIDEAKKHGSPDLILAEDSAKLEAIVEEVLSQAKSALDVAVKVLEPIAGIKLHTYGDGGKDVIKALRNNVPKELQEKVAPLIELVEQESDAAWLKFLKKHRDDQHYKNLGMLPMRANAQGDSEPPVMPDGRPVGQTLNVIHVNLFTFLMDFVAASQLIRMPIGLGYSAEGDGLSKKYRLALFSIQEVEAEEENNDTAASLTN